MSANRYRSMWVFAGIAVCIANRAFAQDFEADSLLRKQEEQQRAKTLTLDLLAGVLDVQLRQLDENGLSEHEVYREIKFMRQNLNRLAETEMTKIVELLTDARQRSLEERAASLVEVRQQIRIVVRQLSVERQWLLKRLKIVELAEQIRRLIRHQAVVQETTKRIPVEQPARREALTLTVIEDQRDVKELFLHLVETLSEMRSLSGILATAADNGLRILRVREVRQHLERTGQWLQSIKPDAASDEQALVMKGLKELLKVIERAQGPLDAEDMAALEIVRALIEKQKQVRDETNNLAEAQLPSAELVERQSNLQKQIAQLQETILDDRKAHTYLQQAESAAFEAAANLLDRKPEQANADQGRVLGNLAAIERLLRDQVQQRSHDKSAEELALTVRALLEMRAALIDAQANQESVKSNTERDVHSATSTAKDVAEMIQRAGDRADLPAVVETVYRDAIELSKRQLASFEAIPSEPVTGGNSIVNQATNALERAVFTVDAALADVQRQESAIRIGELARAAEVLERLAAEERTIAKDAGTETVPSDQTETLGNGQVVADRQAEVIAIAEKIGEAIAKTAESAASNIAVAIEKSKQSRSSYVEMAEQSSVDSRAAKTLASQAAVAASQQFDSAAKQIRREIVSTANELAGRTTAQASRLAEVRAVVEQSIEQLPSHERTTQLRSAKDKLEEALQHQALALGKPDLAVALHVANLMIRAGEAQNDANALAAKVQSGTDSELIAATRQEEVAELCQLAAEVASGRNLNASSTVQTNVAAMISQLEDARAAFTSAARHILDGNFPLAEASRQAAEVALRKSLLLAKDDLAVATKSPANGNVDQHAQEKALAASVAAQRLASNASDETGADVALATEATQAGHQAFAANREHIHAIQKSAMEALMLADMKLDLAIQKEAVVQTKSLARRADESRALARIVAGVEPSAAETINFAAREAQTGSKATDSLRQISQAARHSEVALEHAVAELGAKEQLVRHDGAIAEAIVSLSREQQTAVEMIAEQVAILEQTVTQPDNEEASTVQQRTAARKMNEAQQQFADAQRATGDGAVELSGQKQVANRPLREALELASNLSSRELPAESSDSTDESEVSSGPPEHEQITQQPSRTSDNSPDGDKSSATAANQSEVRRAGQPNQGTPGSSKPHGMGTGFVPQSPQITAEMMAGPKAQRVAQQALDQQIPISQLSSDQTLPSEQANDLEDGHPIPSEHANASKLTRKEGSSAINQKVKGGVLDRQREGTEAAGMSSSKTREKEERILARQFKQDAWFAKLPPELRKSIRAGAGQKPPRAYEERLKKYFQSVD